jgi:predicted GNAT family acetyltransferase
MHLTVVDNTDEDRFEARTDEGEVAGWVDYRRRPDSVTLVHTEVDEAFHGKRIGSRLVSGTLSQLAAEGVTVINQCPFITRYLTRHPGDHEAVVDAT